MKIKYRFFILIKMFIICKLTWRADVLKVKMFLSLQLVLVF